MRAFGLRVTTVRLIRNSTVCYTLSEILITYKPDTIVASSLTRQLFFAPYVSNVTILIPSFTDASNYLDSPYVMRNLTIL